MIWLSCAQGWLLRITRRLRDTYRAWLYRFKGWSFPPDEPSSTAWSALLISWLIWASVRGSWFRKPTLLRRGTTRGNFGMRRKKDPNKDPWRNREWWQSLPLPPLPPPTNQSNMPEIFRGVTSALIIALEHIGMCIDSTANKRGILPKSIRPRHKGPIKHPT